MFQDADWNQDAHLGWRYARSELRKRAEQAGAAHDAARRPRTQPAEVMMHEKLASCACLSLACTCMPEGPRHTSVISDARSTHGYAVRSVRVILVFSV